MPQIIFNEEYLISLKFLIMIDVLNQNWLKLSASAAVSFCTGVRELEDTEYIMPGNNSNVTTIELFLFCI